MLRSISEPALLSLDFISIAIVSGIILIAAESLPTASTASCSLLRYRMTSDP
jgi:hypothetical protein